MSEARGTLYLVVGPSGAGKDTIIDALRERLKDDRRFHFPTRDITRPADAGGEIHTPLSVTEFKSREANGAYAISWGAHDLFYGVPKQIEAELASGRSIIVNTSRAIIAYARETLAPVKVISLTVPEEVLRARLTARRRETPEEIERRIARAAAFSVEGDDVIKVINDRPIREVLDDLITQL